MEKYLIAHDLGTSGDKASLFSIEGKLVKDYIICRLTGKDICSA